jgi:hypothetical protein
MKTALKKIILLIFISHLLSCGIVEDENIVEEVPAPKEFNMASLKYYMNLQTLMHDNSISPDYMSHLDTVNNFSFGFNCEIKNLYVQEISKVKVKVKYYFPRPGTASIVCTVSKGDSAVYWSAIPLDQSVAIKKWATNEVTFDFLNTFKGDEKLSVYIWAPNRDEVYIEDLQVKPKK